MRALAVVLGYVGWSASIDGFNARAVLLAVCCSGVGRVGHHIESNCAPLNSGFDSLVL
jgi:hypothetical protein